MDSMDTLSGNYQSLFGPQSTFGQTEYEQDWQLHAQHPIDPTFYDTGENSFGLSSKVDDVVFDTTILDADDNPFELTTPYAVDGVSGASGPEVIEHPLHTATAIAGQNLFGSTASHADENVFGGKLPNETGEPLGSPSERADGISFGRMMPEKSDNVPALPEVSEYLSYVNPADEDSESSSDDEREDNFSSYSEQEDFDREDNYQENAFQEDDYQDNMWEEDATAQDEVIAKTLAQQEHSYHLRPNRGDVADLTWMDNDDSGTFDPRRPQQGEMRRARSSNDRRKAEGKQRMVQDQADTVLPENPEIVATISISSDDTDLEDLFQSGISTPENAFTITTSLAHPVLFLHPDQRECDWCNDQVGILGLGEREVLVVSSADRLGYREIRGGHNSLNSSPSRMCEDCTMSRCHILACDGHQFRPLDGLRRNAVGQPTTDGILLQDMFDRLTSGTPSAEDKWCALCPRPALYQCTRSQEMDKYGNFIDASHPESRGCGLMLCGTCKEELLMVGSLDGVVNAIASDGEGEKWFMGARADAELLKRDGLLLRKVNACLSADMEMEWMEVEF